MKAKTNIRGLKIGFILHLSAHVGYNHLILLIWGVVYRSRGWPRSIQTHGIYAYYVGGLLTTTGLL